MRSAPVEISGVITQKLFDGGARRAELERQAARVDSASLRVLERSEYITLQVAREYLEYLLQAEIVKESSANLKFHQGVAGNIGSSIAGGALTEADRQQATERVFRPRPGSRKPKKKWQRQRSVSSNLSANR